MKMVLSPTYVDLFGEDPPPLLQLIGKIPSRLVIAAMSIINSQLYLKNDFETQVRILAFLLDGQPEVIGARVFSKLQPAGKEKPATELFSVLYTTEFIHYELSHFRDLQSEESDADGGLRILKAYFVIADELNSKYAATVKVDEVDEDYFRKNMWPALIDQFDVNNHLINPVKTMPKSIAFLNHFQFQSPYAAYVQKFLDKHGKATSWNYVLDLVGLFQGYWNAIKDDSKKLRPFVILETEGYEAILSSFAVTHQDYAKAYGEAKMNYAGLKDKPLFVFDKGRYIVFNWNFLAAKLYDGLLFDFYRVSGIDAESKFKTFPDFKRFVASEVTEKFLFKKLLKRFFHGKHVVLQLDEYGKQGSPDAYVRDGHNVFLFEIKDAYFPSKSINSLSYQTIRESIDTKFNNDRKGTGQIIKQLEHMSKATYEAESFESLGIKRRNLRIYPVIVFTDNNFALPGINRYLDEEFKKKVQEKGLASSFGSIEDLTCVSLSFLIDHVHYLKDPKYKIKDLLDFYHSKIAAILKKNRKHRSLENLFGINDPFETVVAIKFQGRAEAPENYIEVIVKELGLTENLPKD